MVCSVLLRRVFQSSVPRKAPAASHPHFPRPPGRVCFQRRPVSAFNLFPTVRKYGLSPCGESVPAHEKTAVTASKICGSAVAESRRAPARVRIFLSLSGSAASSVFASSIVGMIAWWSDTFLLSNTFAIPGVKPTPAIKGSFSQAERDNARCGIAHVVGEEAAVRPRISQQLLFIKGLCKVKGLLRGVAENAVRFPLQRGKVKELCAGLRFSSLW